MLKSGTFVITGLHIRVCIGKLLSLFLIQNICCGTQKNRLYETDSTEFAQITPFCCIAKVLPGLGIQVRYSWPSWPPEIYVLSGSIIRKSRFFF